MQYAGKFYGDVSVRIAKKDMRNMQQCYINIRNSSTKLPRKEHNFCSNSTIPRSFASNLNNRNKLLKKR